MSLLVQESNLDVHLIYIWPASLSGSSSQALLVCLCWLMFLDCSLPFWPLVLFALSFPPVRKQELLKWPDFHVKDHCWCWGSGYSRRGHILQSWGVWGMKWPTCGQALVQSSAGLEQSFLDKPKLATSLITCHTSTPLFTFKKMKVELKHCCLKKL